MAIEVFNRYENKYRLDEGVCEKLRRRLADYMEPDKHNKIHGAYAICNLYYDTSDSYLIRNSLAKPVYKEKLRVRSYGVPERDGKVYVEIKKKFHGLVNKRRSALPLDEAYQFLATGVRPEIREGMNSQVLSEIQYFLQQHDLSPQVFLAYERLAFFGTGEHDLRVSFDTKITTRRIDLRLESGIYGEKLLPDGKWLMEVKTAESIPLWLCRILSEYQIYPISFSKYGTEYKQSLMPEMPAKQAS
ncbi:MAG: polyphosphate polymerase domain-containing protein [Clostridiales Family XIII bacterium]|jgi:SPX domain protein involved in polyphosphate accumulation|nr:polyphosphate polymerase domain-containing protein [Clostridiales Family XIII bacterium]